MPQDESLAVQSPLIEVRRVSNRGRGGRGVFAREAIAAGTLIERAPVLLIPTAQIIGDDGTNVPCPFLTWYVFEWHEVTQSEHLGLALGYCSLYNHDWPANAAWERIGPDLLEITAYRDIPAGREITINYHGEPDDPEPMEFLHQPLTQFRRAR